MDDTKTAARAPVMLPTFQVLQPNVAALRVDPGTYIFLVDPATVEDAELLIQAIRSIPDVRGPIIPMPPGRLTSLTEEEARMLWESLNKHFGTEVKRS